MCSKVTIVSNTVSNIEKLLRVDLKLSHHRYKGVTYLNLGNHSQCVYINKYIK